MKQGPSCSSHKTLPISWKQKIPRVDFVTLLLEYDWISALSISEGLNNMSITNVMCAHGSSNSLSSSVAWRPANGQYNCRKQKHTAPFVIFLPGMCHHFETLLAHLWLYISPCIMELVVFASIQPENRRATCKSFISVSEESEAPCMGFELSVKGRNWKLHLE